MMPLPLDQIGFGWRSHLSVLWWLGLLYRKPKSFATPLKELGCWRATASGIKLYLHAMPWIVAVSIVGRLGMHGVLGLPTNLRATETTQLVLVHLGRIAFGIAAGIAIGIAYGIADGIAVGIAVGIAGGLVAGLVVGLVVGLGGGLVVGLGGGLVVGLGGGIVVGLGGGIVVGLGGGIVVGIVFGIAVGIPFEIAGKIASGVAEGIAVGVAEGIAVGVAEGIVGGIAAGIAVLRVYYHLPNILFVWPKPHARWYRFHPVAWDDLCSVPFPGLERLLVAYAEAFPDSGEREIKRLIEEYPSQRGPALKA